MLFDGDSFQSNDRFSFYEGIQCYTQVYSVEGVVTGKVLTKQIMKNCGPDDTIYVVTEKILKEGDILVSASEVITGIDSKVTLIIYIDKTVVTGIHFRVGSESMITTPYFGFECNRHRVTEEKENGENTHEKGPVEEIKVIKGVVTYDAPPEPQFKASTKGKNASVIHTKTRYSHEVKIDGIDTVDVIRVYKGSVEVSMENIEAPNEAEMSKKIEQLGADTQAGKITGEELQAKMKEFQFYGQNLNELIQPLNVDEGFKCTVTKSTRVVEPLGADDGEK